MQAAVFMLMALSGLGCQNKTGEPSDLPAVLSPALASPSVGATRRRHEPGAGSSL